MIVLIWITPLLFAICSTLVFNAKTSTTSIQDNYILYSILDIIKTYSFMMIFLNLIVNQQIFFTLGFIFLFFVTILIHLGLNSEQHEDINVVFETLKNNVVVQMTTLVLFLVFLYIYRDMSTQLYTIVYSIISTIALVIISYWLKKLTEIVKDNIQTRMDMASKFDMLLFYFSSVLIFTMVLVLFFLTVKLDVQKEIDPSNTYYISTVDKDNIFDWDTVTVLETKIITNDGYVKLTYMLIKDSDDIEYIVILNSDESILSPEFSYFQLSENNQTDFGNNQRLIGTHNLVIPSSDGLYIYSDNQVSVLSKTENKPTGYVSYDNNNYYLVQEGNQHYTLINSDFENVEIILNQELVIINNQLFINDGTIYMNYFDNSLTYQIINDSVPYYDVKSGYLYQIEYQYDEAFVTISNDGNNKSRTISIIPIFDGTYYNHYQFFYPNKTVKLNNSFFITALKNSDNSYDTFIIYNDNRYFIDYTNSPNITVLEKVEYNSKISYELSTYNFVGNEESLATNEKLIVIRYCSFILVFLFVPITNYEKYTTIDSFFNRTQ